MDANNINIYSEQVFAKEPLQAVRQRMLLLLTIVLLLLVASFVIVVSVYCNIFQAKHVFSLYVGMALMVALTTLIVLLGLFYSKLRQIDRSLHKQQNELSEREQLLSAISHSAHDAIVMIDNDGKVTHWNRAAEQIFGYASKEILGCVLHDFITPERLRANYYKAFSHFRTTGKGAAINQTLELPAIRKDAQELSVELSLAATYIKNSWHAVGIIRDITARKQDEETLRKTLLEVELARQQLETVNRDLEEQTELANEMAIRADIANMAKSEFLANMSHEIRTPMNGVIGMTSLLLETDLNDEQRHYAETVRNSGESLLSLLNDILDFSKIEAGKLTLEVLDFNLQKLLENFAATMALKAHEKGLEFVYDYDIQIPRLLRGDPNRLRQILTNLVGNAIKFTHSGEVAIHIMTKAETSDSLLLHFSVRDTGIGIPQDKLDLLFGKFSQVDTSTTRKYGGTGLGLAISKQLVEMMGGEIGVSSQNGHGSEFWFTVLLDKQIQQEKPEMLPAKLNGTKVLIVDDNQTNRDILLTQLTFWEMCPTEVVDGVEALQLLHKAAEENDPYLLALIDMQMPGMDGETLGRIIKADKRLIQTQMVMMTSIGTPHDSQHFKKVGFAAYLTKPVKQSNLFNVLTTILHSSEQDPEPFITSVPAAQYLFQPNGQQLLASARVLLVEDNITNQKVAQAILSKIGLHVDTAVNGAEAVKALEMSCYDLVLMDVQMPVMNGLDATRRIRDPQSAVINRDIPIIAMTAHAMRGDRETCLDAGMNDYISKPVTPATLVEKLQKWLGEEKKAQHPIDKIKPVVDNEVKVFDYQTLLERLLDDESLAKTILEGFLNDIPQQIQHLKDYLDCEDVAGSERQAHTIKGAAANIGGECLQATALEIEQSSKNGDLSTAKSLFTELETQFARLQQAIGTVL